MRHLKWLGGLALTALLLAEPGAAARGVAEAMACWYASVAPALFPFLALMPLLTCGEAARAYERLLGRITRRLFDLPGAAAPAMVAGIVAGAPAGAIAVHGVAARAGMDRGRLARTAVAFTGFSPAFLVGGVGAGMLGSAALGWRLLKAQLLTQATLALLLRRAWRDRTQAAPDASEAGEVQPVRGAVLAILGVCGYMTLFGALNGAAGALVGRGPADALLCLLDVPSGAARVAGLALPDGIRLPLLAGMCGFGGACVIAQCLGALRGCGVGAAEYVGLRAAAGAICAGYMALLTRLSAGGATRLALSVRENPFAAAGLAASLLALPALARMKKSIS